MRIPERWDEIEDVVGGLLDVSPDERDKQLAELATTDPALKREVERLLRACDDAESDAHFLASPATEFLSPVLSEVQAADAAGVPPPEEILDRLRGSLSHRYAVEREVGEGGMATVFVARDLRHARQVAIKVMRPDLNPGMGGSRFLREIRTLAGLSHPHILPLYDSGEADGLLYYVTPFLEGESLRRRLARQRALDVAEAMRITREVASALAYAHRHGVVHRDIKPENILFQDGHAIVADFGIARALDRALEPAEARTTDMVTPLWFMVGTPAYMAPEHLLGAVTDHRVDLYALGVVAYEMLTGGRPIISASTSGDPDSDGTQGPIPQQLRRANVPPQFSETVTTLLARRPEDRYESADQLLAALDTATPSAGGTAQEVERVRPSGSLAWWNRMRGWIPSQPRARVAVFVTLSVAVLAAGAVAVTRVAAGSNRASAVPIDPRKVAVAAFDPLNESVRDPSSPRIEQLVSDWLTRGLLQTQLLTVVPIGALAGSSNAGNGQDQRVLEVARAAGAGLLVSGSHYRTGDSLFLTARITDVATGTVRRGIGPVASPATTPLEAAERLRQAVISTMATLIDRRMANWASAASQPSNFEAYQAFADGLAAFFVPEREGDPQPHFLKAHQLDTNFYTPLLWTFFRSAWPEDSARKAYLLERRSKLPPWDRGMLDWATRKNPEEGYQAWRRVVDAAPQSEWLYMLAWTAMQTNRPAVALRALQHLDPNRGWIREWDSYWWLLAEAHHALGQYREELAAIRQGLERFPASRGLAIAEIRPLSALGDETILRSKLAQMTYSSTPLRSAWPIVDVIRELTRHGYVGLANEFGDRQLAEIASGRTGMPPNVSAEFRLRYLLALRRWNAVGSLLDSLHSADSSIFLPANMLQRRAIVAAARGSRSEAFRLAEEARDVRRAGSDYSSQFVAELGFNMTRAVIHALLDEPEQAMTVLRLAQADRQLLHPRWVLSDWPLDNLNNYPAFREFERRHYDDPDVFPDRN